MNWTDDAFVLSSKRYGESALILSLLTKKRGKHSGFLRSISRKNMRSIVQPGNLVRVNWRSRIEESLGTYNLELIESSSSNFLYNPIYLLTLSSICSICNETLPERESFPTIYSDVYSLFTLFNNYKEVLISKYIFFELEMLSALGFGLDISSCVVTGKKENLFWVSPKTGKAVSYDIGIDYSNKLLELPSFLIEKNYSSDMSEIYKGLVLTGYFLKKFLYNELGKDLPINRLRLLEKIEKLNNYDKRN
ncbi:MAG: DNA repair protein RecO [Alphaproteobacteria bacterium MarineAlpha2_Bin1]|nr:MAG: DNA repair protein RecO [Alphaproteobacteria bacterium MarineAlpha2_Bin1]